MATTTPTPDAYLDEAAYHRLLGELEALRALEGDPPYNCPRTWAVEFLGLAGVWPASCLQTLDAEAG